MRLQRLSSPPRLSLTPLRLAIVLIPVALVLNLAPRIRFPSKLAEKPLLREDLKLDSVLKTLMVVRQSNCTNYKVTQQEWQRVHELKG